MVFPASIEKFKPQLPEGTPRYLYVTNVIFEMIESGQLEVGDRLPSERNLCMLFGVTRSTIRQALQVLISDGVVTKKRGSGSYISEPKMERTTVRNSFTEEVTRSGKKPGAKVIQFIKQPIKPELAKVFTPSISSDIFYCGRVRLIDNMPVMLEKNYLPECYFPEIDNMNLNDVSLWDTFRRQYNIIVSRAQISIESVAASAFEAHHLKVEMGVPLIVETRVAFDQNHRAVEYAKDCYRGDCFRFQCDITIK